MVLTRRDELHQSLLALLHHFHAHKNDEFRSEKYTLCLKNDSNIAHYNFKVHEPILVTFGRDVVERARYRMELFRHLIHLMSLLHLEKHGNAKIAPFK